MATPDPTATDYIKPDLYHLLNELSEISWKYRQIGIALRVPNLGLLSLPDSHADNLRRTLEWWMDNGDRVGSPVTYETVINAIKGPIVENFRVSEQLRKSLKDMHKPKADPREQPISLSRNDPVVRNDPVARNGDLGSSRNDKKKMKEVYQVIKENLEENKESLKQIFNDSKGAIAHHMARSQIIETSTGLAPTYEAIIEKFLLTLSIKRKQVDFENYCNMFLKVFTDVSGPSKELAKMLQEEWMEEVQDRLDIELKLVIDK